MGDIANKDEAEKCIEIGLKHLAAGNHEKALKFFRKSDALYSTDRAKHYISRVDPSGKPTDDGYGSESSNAGSPHPSRNHTGTDEGVSAGAEAHMPSAHKRKAHTHGHGGEGGGAHTGAGSRHKDYTPEQEEAVKNMRKRGTSYYAVLGVQKNADDAAIKKAYRKLALQFHPDKNKAPGAAEAFKLIGKAFKVLSEPSSRRTYDLQGDEGLQRASQRGGGGYQADDFDNFSAEEMFQMFFGGITPTELRNRRTRQAQQRRAHGAGESTEGGVSALVSLLPLLILMAATFFASLVEPAQPFSMMRTHDYRYMRTTDARGVPYYVRQNEHEFNREYKGAGDRFRLEEVVESHYLHNLQDRCRREKHHRDMEIHRANTWGDRVGLERARKKELLSCKAMQRFYSGERVTPSQNSPPQPPPPPVNPPAPQDSQENPPPPPPTPAMDPPAAQGSQQKPPLPPPTPGDDSDVKTGPDQAKKDETKL